MLKEIIDQVGSRFHDKLVKTTGFAFKLLTRITVNILLACALIISLKQFFGEPIDCEISGNTDKRTIETKCWIEGVYIDKTLLNGVIGKDITRWGVGPTKRYNPDNYIHQNYYQWIVPMLLLQSLLLYMPRVNWHIWENGLMAKLLTDTDFPLVTEDWTNKKIYILRFLKEVSMKHHRTYVVKYFVCELAAFGILIFNMFLMHWVMNNFWVEFRPAIGALLEQNFTSFSQQSAKIFPTQAKCFYYDFGQSGSAQERDALCFLPQNVINEKVFVFLFFWFIFIFIVAFINLSWFILMLTFKCLRIYDVRRMSDRPHSRRFQLFFDYYSDYGYWFTLRLIHMNLSPVLFRDFLLDLKGQDAKKPKAPVIGQELNSVFLEEDPQLNQEIRVSQDTRFPIKVCSPI